MGIAGNKGEDAVLFCGLLYSDATAYNDAKTIVVENFGAVGQESAQFDWGYYQYYKDEIGQPIYRRYITIDGLFDTQTIADVKHKTNGMEGRLSVHGRRRVNIDPGYITLAKVVLVSTKNYAHRIYLRDGIYAEITLIYYKDSFMPHLFTYPDYKEPATNEFLLHGRKVLKRMLRLSSVSI
ncbi:MAG: DUF4416 family protein [Nitrospirae bacterium]|nr:DUF4416 family protein [Nitrospirota bacterium]